jgi:hypothetical protein
VAAILAGVALYLCYRGTPMIWDGAYQFALTLIWRSPYHYESRFHSYLVWLPVVWAQRVTHSEWVLEFIYGLPFCLAPVVGLLVSWWMVKDHAPGLIIWAIFGVAAASLPGQIFIINDSIFQQHLFWPVFLGAMMPLSWPKRIVLCILVVFQFSHQIGFVLLTGAAVATAIVAIRDRPMRKELLIRSAILLVLAAGCVWKMHLFPDSYAEQQFNWMTVTAMFFVGVAGYPIEGLCLMWLAGTLLFVDAHLLRFDPPKLRRRLAAAVLSCAAIAGIIWIVWASNPHHWWKALDYRRWLVPLTLPFFTLAFLEALLRGDRPDAEPATIGAVRGWLGVTLAVIFAVVLLIQSQEFTSMGNRLMADVEKSPTAVVTTDGEPWLAETCFDHWGASAYVLVRQGMKPTRWLLDSQPDEMASALSAIKQYPNAVPLCYFTYVDAAPGRDGWYDLREVHAELLAWQRSMDAKRGK